LLRNLVFRSSFYTPDNQKCSGVERPVTKFMIGK